MTLCEWCGKKLDEDQAVFCSDECGSAWKRNDIMQELRYEQNEEEQVEE